MSLNYKKLSQLGLPLIIIKFLSRRLFLLTMVVPHKFYIHLSLKLMKEHIMPLIPL